MLKVRVIPTLLWKPPSLVKGVAFDSERRIGAILPAIKVHSSRDIDELIVVDVTATLEGREPDHETVAEFAAHCFVPLTVGGGVSSVDHFTKLLGAGADKISLNSAAYETPDLVNDAARRFGAQCVVVSMDFRRDEDGKARLYSRSGTAASNRDPLDFAKEMVDRGAGELLVTAIERDGTMEGYDLDLMHAIAEAVPVPVICSGGAGDYADMVKAVEQGASAVSAGAMFQFTQNTPAGAKQALGEAGFPVRKKFVSG